MWQERGKIYLASYAVQIVIHSIKPLFLTRVAQYVNLPMKLKPESLQTMKYPSTCFFPIFNFLVRMKTMTKKTGSRKRYSHINGITFELLCRSESFFYPRSLQPPHQTISRFLVRRNHFPIFLSNIELFYIKSVFYLNILTFYNA